MNNQSIVAHTSPPYSISYSDMLKGYMEQRLEGKRRFFISEWLDALPQDVLNELDEYVEAALASDLRPKGVLLDIVNLCEAAFAAEKQAENFPKHRKEIRKVINNLRMIAALVAISKDGYIRLYGPLALSSNEDFKFILTEAGRKIGFEFGLLAK